VSRNEEIKIWSPYDRLTDTPRYSVGNNKMHLCTQYCNAA